MKTILLLILGLATRSHAFAQEVIPLYPGLAPGSVEQPYPEKEFFSKVWNTEVVTNVTKPVLIVYKPTGGASNGNAVVVCPGGGFMALSINSEGIDVAKWFASRGITAFVLKYRLAHTGEDATQEFMDMWQDKPKFNEMLAQIVPLSIQDGLAAVTYVRKHAADLGITADRVGLIGFSAGGEVAAAAKGGHGFGMKKQGLPSDNWIDRLGDWLQMEGWLSK